MSELEFDLKSQTRDLATVDQAASRRPGPRLT